MPTTQPHPTQQAARAYRCHYTPLDRDGWPVPSESGVLPFVDVRASNAEVAQRLAHARTSCPITSCERLDERALPQVSELHGGEASVRWLLAGGDPASGPGFADTEPMSLDGTEGPL